MNGVEQSGPIEHQPQSVVAAVLAAGWLGSRSCYRIPDTRLQIQFLISFKEQEVRCSFVQSALPQPAQRRLWKPDISYLNELPPISHFSPLISVFIREGEGEGERYVLLLLHIKYICIFYDDSLGVSLSSDLTRDDDG